ncbi:MAG: hypothetical protein ACRBCJ_00635 [Hyphomicrobiaceae bacterium]
MNIQIGKRFAFFVGAIGWFVVGMALTSTARAAENANLECTFTTGISGSYDDGAFASETAAALSFQVHDIDVKKQTATLVKKTGAKGRQVRIVRAINANHFLEVVNEGFLNITTIYDVDPKTKAHPAVHSRHFGVLGQPLFAQYAGTCKNL